MTAEQQVEQAFQRLERQSQPLQEVLRPLLMEVMSDPDTLRILSNHALVDHLMYVAAVLGTWSGTKPSERPRLPPRMDTFVNLTVGRGFEDVEQAYDYVHDIAPDKRQSLDEALRIALELPSRRGRRDDLSLLALARLLRIALKRPEAIEHFMGGGAVTPFIEPATKDLGSDARASRKPATQHTPAPQPSGTWSASFNGRLVVVLVAMPRANTGDHTHVLEYFGRCLEVGPNHMVINIRPDEPDVLEPVLVGLSNVIQMRRVPEEYLAML